MSTAYTTRTYIFDPRPAYPFRSAVKRFWKPDLPESTDSLTLVFAHGTSFHKEQWEPAINDLDILVQKSGGKVKIRELWTIDAPNHGDAAILNEQELKIRNDVTFDWQQYALCILLVLSGKGTGVDVDFRKHKIVGIGHSMGAASLGLSLWLSPKIDFVSFIFCELMIVPPELSSATVLTLVSGAEKRRDLWSSKQEAYKLMKSRGVWKSWDDRVLRTYVEYGLRHLPTATYPHETKGVTLKCTSIQEAVRSRSMAS